MHNNSRHNSKSLKEGVEARPYVYRCVHSVTHEFYIGYREANIDPGPIDLPKYRTSSKKVKPKFEEFNWEILAEFDTGDDAYKFEQQLIHENWKNPLSLNQNCQFNDKQRIKGGAKKGTKYPPRSEQHKKNMSLSMTGKKLGPQSAEQRAVTSAALKGKIRSEEHKKNLSKSLTGLKKRPQTVEERAKKSLALKGRPNKTKGIPVKKVACPHCNTVGGTGVMRRWHFDNCKDKQ